MDLDEQLREAGERWRASGRAPVADFRRATATPARRSRTPRRSRGLLAVPIMLGAFLLASGVVFFAQGNSSSTKVTVTQPTTPTTAPELPSVLTLDPQIVQTAALAIDGASVWVTGDAPQSRAATLEHIDTRTGNVIGKVVLPDNGPFQIAVGDGAVWVCSQQNEESAHLVKIDPKTMRITAIIETAGDASVAVTPDAVWVDHSARANPARRDPETNKLLASLSLPGAPWIQRRITFWPARHCSREQLRQHVVRVDPSTNTVKQIADVGNYAGEIVELDGSLWVNAGNALVEVDPTTGAVRQTIPLAVRSLTSDGRSLWGSTDRPSVLRIDPRTGRSTPVTLPADAKSVFDVAGEPATGSVWASSDTPTPRLLHVAP